MSIKLLELGQPAHAAAPNEGLRKYLAEHGQTGKPKVTGISDPPVNEVEPQEPLKQEPFLALVLDECLVPPDTANIPVPLVVLAKDEDEAAEAAVEQRKYEMELEHEDGDCGLSCVAVFSREELLGFLEEMEALA
jgi:hypothetical protein